MRCVYNEEGCSWKGEKSQLITHLETCEFDIKDCPADCGHKVSCAVLQEHLNAECKTKYSKRCEYCGAIFSIESQTTHVAICSQLPIPCPNNCLIGCVPRGQLDEHLNQECEMSIQVCPFNDVGCKYKASTIKSSEHLKDNLDNHLFKLNAYVQQTMNQLIEENKRIKEENGRLRTCLTKLTETVNTEIEKNEVTRAKNEVLNTGLTELAQTVNKEIEKNEETRADNEILNLGFIELKEMAKTFEGYKTVETEIQRLGACLSQLTLTVKREIEKNEKTRAQNVELNTRFTKLSQTVHSQNEEYKKLKSEIERVVTGNVFIWGIDHFQSLMDEARNGDSVLLSPLFESHIHGYVLRLQLFLNGKKKGKSTHMSLYLQLMKGKGDNQLEWPFPHKVELTLFDQNSNSNQAEHLTKILDRIPLKYIRRPREIFNIGCGFDQFVSHEDLYKRNYIKDDEIIIMARVIKN